MKNTYELQKETEIAHFWLQVRMMVIERTTQVNIVKFAILNLRRLHVTYVLTPQFLSQVEPVQ